MPAHSEEYPWMSYYGNYIFFEKKMKEHSKVETITKINPSFYQIKLTDGRVIKTFICECYSFGIAEYLESCHNLGELNAVVISSNWCSYSLEVKRHCMDKNVGVYDIGGFMAAINMDNYWQYLTESEKEKFQEKGWSYFSK
ncbi:MULTISPECIES: hypothetical protein [Legionella]|uniref:Uncharacterized protein n=1 Tax=Legionella maceachernii TaxID=466 RepID=A0A0W0W6P7_9GAMM|nr:hypothetical protein [Legionella maceachernii]KTD27978.1 hypothetical protein Lmac_1037 [Legionella maceachernii]SKA06128.1 hypothetical protein SAMN02745128_01924 [Legionella maceachernii]SUO99918.1 Uncharacterised protein [Legionella maceachernii]